MPQPAKTHRKYMHQLLELGVFGGGKSTATGSHWVLARTKNFRRKGVGSHWRSTNHLRA